MILLLDTSGEICRLTLVDCDSSNNIEWQAGRSLAKDLLSFLQQNLKKYNKDWKDIEAIGVFKGPGSFTGLRIGLTVCNTIADGNNIPIVGASGFEWQDEVLARLSKKENDKIVLPNYGSKPNITLSTK